MKRRLLLFLLFPFLLFSVEVNGQAFCTSPGGGAFDIIPSEGCAPLTVAVTNKKQGGDKIEYAYNWDKAKEDFPDVNEKTSSTSNQYTKAGTYTILQWGSSGQGGFTACKDVVVRETLAPNAQLTTCKSGRVRLTLIDDAIYRAYDAIEIDWGNGQKITVNKGGLLIHDKVLGTNPSVKIKGVYNQGFCTAEVKSNTLTGLINPPSLASIKITRIEMGANGTASLVYEGMEGIETELYVSSGGGAFTATGKKSKVRGTINTIVENLDPNQVYTFKLVSKDICDNLTDSPIASSVVLEKDAVVSDESNSMTWDNYIGSGNSLVYQILRDDNINNGELVFNSADALFFSDDKVKCGETYTYQLLVADGGVTSYSAPLEMVPTTSQPEKITTASVTVQDANLISTSVSFSGNGITSTYNLIVERANAGSSDFQQVSPSGNQSITFEDADVSTSNTSYCYRFIYENSCKKISPPSDPICSILLTNNIQNISWSDASPFSSAIESYDLVKMDVSEAVQDEIPKQLQTNHAIDLNTDGNSSFKVKAKYGNMVSYSNVVSISGDVIMLVPDIFTPNGDTHNDKFEVKSIFTNSFRMRIYSRWGEMVFQSENAVDGWDGNIGGKPAADGHYVYKIEATTLKGEPISKTGSLMLVR